MKVEMVYTVYLKQGKNSLLMGTFSTEENAQRWIKIDSNECGFNLDDYYIMESPLKEFLGLIK